VLLGIVCDEADEVGNADGLGETRKKELVKSGMYLGLRKEDDVFVIESPYVSLYGNVY
jgi:hypothetical protein